MKHIEFKDFPPHVILDVDSAITVDVWRYPNLFVGESYNDTRMNWANQTFNVIGNNITDYGRIIELYHFSHKINFRMEHTVPVYNPDVKVFVVYREFGEHQYPRSYKFGFPKSKINSFFLESELGQFDLSKVYAEQISNSGGIFSDPKRAPYPNFQKEYSLVWKLGNDVYKLPISWIELAIEFYQNSRSFFTSDEVERYHLAGITSSADKFKIISGVVSYISSVGLDVSNPADYPNISKMYGMEFTGDVEDLMLRLWEQQKVRTLGFIEETLTLLNDIHATKLGD